MERVVPIKRLLIIVLATFLLFAVVFYVLSRRVTPGIDVDILAEHDASIASLRAQVVGIFDRSVRTCSETSPERQESCAARLFYETYLTEVMGEKSAPKRP